MTLSFQEYLQAGKKEKKELIRYIELIRPDLHFDSFVTDSLYHLPRFRFSRLPMHFIYIPGGKFNMGLSEKEESAAREICDPPPMIIAEMRPVTEVTIESFLVAEAPFLNGHAMTMWPYVSNSLVDIRRPCHPYWCEFETAQNLAAALNTQLPHEDQWEYFCRANTNTLFCFGDTIPDEPELQKWFDSNFCDMSAVKKNNFGVSGLFFEEWSADLFRYDYSPNAKTATHTRVLRGGAADFWPWKGEEWIWCASAMRMPSTYLVCDEAVFRLVINLNTENT
jgi:formylglycine-generating enzyme required for sulfatase activity